MKAAGTPITGPLSTPTTKPATVRTDDGWLLRGEILAPPQGKGVALLLHAMMVSRKTMDRPRGAGLGTTLAAMGLGVVNFDLRGHGESGPSARDGARFSYDDYVQRDIPALILWARKTFPNERLVVVGHSLGGHTSLASAGLFPDKAPDRIISIAGNMWLPSFEKSRPKRLAKTITLRSWLEVAERWGYFDPAPLGMGTDAIALPYIQQFWQMWSTDRYASSSGEYDYKQALANVQIPVLSIASEGDELLANPEAVKHFADCISSAQKQLRIIKAEESSSKAPSHMGLVTNPASLSIWEEIGSYALSPGS